MDRQPPPTPVIRFIAPLGCDRMSVQRVSGEPLAMVEYYDRDGRLMARQMTEVDL